MYCGNCGAKLNDNDKFCKKCGWPVPVQPAAAGQKTPPAAPAQPVRPVAVQQATAHPVKQATAQQATTQARPAAAQPVKQAAAQSARIPERPETGQPAAPPEPGKEPPKKKHTARSILIAALVLALVGGGIFLGIHLSKNKQNGQDAESGTAEAASTETSEDAAPVDDEEVEDDREIAYTVLGEDELPKLVLYADKVMFYAEDEKDITLTIRVPGELSFAPVRIVTEDEKELASITEDQPAEEELGYREYSVPVRLEKYDTGVTSLYAVMGEEKSSPLDIYSTGHITGEMMRRCADVGAELEAWLLEKGMDKWYGEGRGDECQEEVLKWLQADDRVLSAEANGDAVVYCTVDHVGGTYLPPIEEGYLGSGDEESGLSVTFDSSKTSAKAFENYDKTGHVGGESERFVYIDGGLSITNDKFLVMTPWEDTADTVVGWLLNKDIVSSGKKHLKMANEYAKDLGYEVTHADFVDTLCAIFNGDLSDYGIITLMCHGATLKREDGTQSVIFCMPGSEEGYNGRSCFELMAQEELEDEYISEIDDYYQYFYREETFNADHTLMTLDGGAILIGGNFIIHRYQNRFFDNTIFYTGACYGGCDQKLIRFCLNHGMQAYIGHEHKASAAAQPERFDRVFSDLKTKYLTGQTMRLENAARIVVANDNYRANIKWKSWRIIGYGKLKGKVQQSVTHLFYGADGTVTESKDYKDPEDPVKLTYWHFMDQSFESPETIETKADGTFEIKKLRWGVYGVLADPGGEPEDNVYSGFTLADAQFDGGVLEVPRPTASLLANLYYRDGAEGELKPVGDYEAKMELIEDDGSIYESYIHQGKGGDPLEYKGLKPGTYQLTILAKEGTYKATIGLKKGCDYEYEQLILNSRVIGGVVVGTRDNDDMWYAHLYLLDENDHLLLKEDGDPSVLPIFDRVFVSGVYGNSNDVGTVSVWKIDRQTILMDARKDLSPEENRLVVFTLDENGAPVEKTDVDPAAFDRTRLELLLECDLVYDKLLTDEKVISQYYVPADTPRAEDRQIDLLLEDLTNVFSSPKLVATDLEKTESGTLTAYTETYQSGKTQLIIRALADGRITSVRIDDHGAYKFDDYKAKADSRFFSVSREMKDVYEAVMTSEVLEIHGDREKLKDFVFNDYKATENSINGTKVGYQLEGGMKASNVTVSYVKSTWDIPSTTFTSYVDIQLTLGGQ